VSFADYMQTDDLFQLGKPLELPKLPDLDLHEWPCPHPPIAGEPAELAHAPIPVGSAGGTIAPAPTMPPALGQLPHAPIASQATNVGLASTPVAGTGATTARAPTEALTPVQSIGMAATLASVAVTQSPKPRPPGRDPDSKPPPAKPFAGRSTSVKAPQEQFAKLLGVVEPSFGGPTSTAAPSVAQPSGPITPDPLRLSGAASLEGGSK
jgi:hypothetical protein